MQLELTEDFRTEIHCIFIYCNNWCPFQSNRPQLRTGQLFFGNSTVRLLRSISPTVQQTQFFYTKQLDIFYRICNFTDAPVPYIRIQRAARRCSLLFVHPVSPALCIRVYHGGWTASTKSRAILTAELMFVSVCGRIMIIILLYVYLGKS